MTDPGPATRPSRIGGSARAGALAVGALLLLGACGPAAPSGPATGALPGASASGPAAATSAGESTAPGVSSAPGPLATRSGIIDPALLALVPAEVAGLPVHEDAAAAAQAATDPQLAAVLSAYETGVVGDNGANIAAFVLAIPKPAVDVVAYFARWRIDYDKSGCEPAGGALANRTEVIAGRHVEITACAGGATIYHALVGSDGRTILSILEVGPKMLGRQMLANLPGG